MGARVYCYRADDYSTIGYFSATAGLLVSHSIWDNFTNFLTIQAAFDGFLDR